MRVGAVLVGWLVPAVAWAGDKDRDGLHNKIDACIDVAEDPDGFEDGDGCPEFDNDRDQLVDGVDRCPDLAEDPDGFRDDDGCPDPDNDEDGVLDADDRCSDEREDGTDGDGCLTVTLELLSEDGYLPGLGALSSSLLAAIVRMDSACVEAASAGRQWLERHDPVALAEQWDRRLARAPESFDDQAAIDLLGRKGDSYRPLRQALGAFCAREPGWREVEARLDAGFSRLPPSKGRIR